MKRRKYLPCRSEKSVKAAINGSHGGKIGGPACWAGVGKAERSRRMRLVAARRWAGATKQELREHALLMVRAREMKRERAS